MKKQTPIIYDWKNVSVEQMEKEYDALIVLYRAEIARLIAKTEPCIDKDFTLLNELSDKMQKLWSPIVHLKGVVEPRINKEVFARCMEKRSAFITEISQNEEWYRVCKAFHESAEYEKLSAEEKMAEDNSMRDFRLSGIDLPADKKAEYKKIALSLTALTQKFSENITDSASPDAWSKLVTDEKILDGLPDWMKENARKTAAAKGKEGFLFFLGQATWMTIMQGAHNRDLRREFHEVWATRASDKGPNAGKWDNSPLIEKILALCHEKAQLLDFKNYAACNLATKMATSEKEVMDFLYGILEKAREPLVREIAEITEYAREHDGIKKLEPWDISYYFERVKEEKYSFSEEEVRKYFPLPKVLDGMFAIVNKLYGVSFKERKGVPLWHADAKYFDMYDAKGKVTGGIYMDFYERTEGKRPGAWMDDAIIRRKLPNGNIQLPVGYLTCNFSEPEGDKPSLLTSEQVETNLHEFGHDLQHLLTKCTVASVSGINGVPWDGVELASQFMENFLWTREGVDMLSGHYETGEKLPDELFQKMLRARNFGQGYWVARQLSFALSDFRLYSGYDPKVGGRVNELFREVQEDIFPMITLPEYSRMPCNFGHIFGGGYAAGYYSYMWALILAAGAFSAFVKKDGTIDWKMGKKFLKQLLSRGGSRPFMDSYVAFRGRKPNEDALMRQFGFMK